MALLFFTQFPIDDLNVRGEIDITHLEQELMVHDLYSILLLLAKWKNTPSQTLIVLLNRLNLFSERFTLTWKTY